MMRYGWMMLWGGLGSLLLLLLLIGLVVWLAVSLARNRRGEVPALPARPSQDSALETLRVRYAKGEISKEQYEEMRRDLGG